MKDNDEDVGAWFSFIDSGLFRWPAFNLESSSRTRLKPVLQACQIKQPGRLPGISQGSRPVCKSIWM